MHQNIKLISWRIDHFRIVDKSGLDKQPLFVGLPSFMGHEWIKMQVAVSEIKIEGPNVGSIVSTTSAREVYGGWFCRQQLGRKILVKEEIAFSRGDDHLVPF